MPLTNPVSITAITSTSSAATTITSATQTTPFLVANANRKGFTIQNASTATLYIDFAATVSVTAYAVAIAGGGYFESTANWAGAVSGIWSAQNGSALIRELS